MTLPLCQLPAGRMGRIHALIGDANFCQRIRELGFGEATMITKIGGTGPFICQVNGTRIALGHGAAAQIVVTPLS
jgi:ferrous iron transport protein A